MIKNQLIEAVRNRLGAVSSREVGAYVQFVFEAISDALKDGDSVKITNFGVWSTRYKKARMGRNPKTCIAAEIRARRVVKFRMSKVLAGRFNADGSACDVLELDDDFDMEDDELAVAEDDYELDDEDFATDED